MSSGAYAVEIPVAIIGVVVGGTAAALGAVGDAALSASGIAANAARNADEELKRLDRMRTAIDAEYLRVQESAQAVLSDIHAFRESLKSLNFQYSAETATFREREAGESTGVVSSLDLSDLMFMEVDVQTEEITYVVLDYSGTLSLRNAKNSAQFKKMALASDLMKKVMLWVTDSAEEQTRLNQLIGVVNGMLDDDSVSFVHFREFVELRFAAFQRMQDELEYDPQLWEEYCALCAMRGERPRRVRKDALAQEVLRLKTEAVSTKFVANARAAFLEAVAQLGLEVHSGHVLDRVSGTMLVDKENPGFSLFFSEHDVSFLLEMVDNGETDPAERRKQHDNVCRKRRQLEELMLRKGYRLKVCAEDDTMCAKLTGVEKKDASETRAEQLRRRRALAGKKARMKMAGGR